MVLKHRWGWERFSKLQVSSFNSAVQKLIVYVSCLGWHPNYCIEENASMGHLIPPVLGALGYKAHRKIVQVVTSTIPSAFSGRETCLGSWLQLCCLDIEVHVTFPECFGRLSEGRKACWNWWFWHFLFSLNCLLLFPICNTEMTGSYQIMCLLVHPSSPTPWF